jgi:hypothetical protein
MPLDARVCAGLVANVRVGPSGERLPQQGSDEMQPAIGYRGVTAVDRQLWADRISESIQTCKLPTVSTMGSAEIHHPPP